MVGIYKITNPKGEAYIGLSKNIEKRWSSHRNLQFKGNIKLRNSLTLYSIDSHVWEIIEVIDITSLSLHEGNALLRKRERYWIQFYDTFKNGLNENGGGSGCGEHTEESKKKISEALKNKPKPSDFGANRKKWQHTEEYKEKVRNSPRCPILMFDLEDNFIKEFPNQKAAADYLGLKKQSIWNYLNGYCKPNCNPATHVRGYKFKYK